MKTLMIVVSVIISATILSNCAKVVSSYSDEWWNATQQAKRARQDMKEIEQDRIQCEEELQMCKILGEALCIPD